MSRVLVCGSRHFNDGDIVARELSSIGDISEIIHGGAPGADTCAGTFARDNSIPVNVYPALWQLYGVGAGPERNRRMLAESKPDLVVAFWDGQSRGTKHMIGIAEKAGVEVRIINI